MNVKVLALVLTFHSAIRFLLNLLHAIAPNTDPYTIILDAVNKDVEPYLVQELSLIISLLSQKTDL